MAVNAKVLTLSSPTRLAEEHAKQLHADVPWEHGYARQLILWFLDRILMPLKSSTKQKGRLCKETLRGCCPFTNVMVKHYWHLEV